MPVALRQFLVNLPRPCKQIMAAALDAVLLLASFYLALWARFEVLYVNHYYAILSLIACASGIAALAAFRVYFYILRYMNERVLIGVTCGVIVSVLTVTAVDTFLRLSLGLSRAVLIIYPLLALILLLGVRIVARRLLFPGTRAVATGMQTPVIIYGSGGLGSQLAAALRASPHYLPVAMIDDDPRKHRLFMAGLRIYPPSQLARLVAKHQVTQLLIAMPSASRTRIRQVVDMAEPFRLRIRTVSSLRELVDPRRGPRLRDIQVEDLLGRDPIPPIPELLGRCVTGRNIMITGAGGSIGSELCRQILELRPRRMVLFEISEPALYTIEQELTTLRNTAGSEVEIIGVLGSVRDYEHCLLQLRRHGIQTVYHAAAYKHVPIVEHNIAEGILTNTFGTHAMARAAIKVGVQDFVLISTRKLPHCVDISQ
ncbi:polysaccharide biosynthesis protein [Bordetella petrii]